ncbi:MAG: hypothetical protein HC924_10225 [Synechococcaceae cyanobacterium SM2_3_2]|nr:hypothetical protein [Synechococcaceae cyanobacterium SM2_3_2]
MTDPPQPIFFIDWCLGKSVASALSDTGAQVEHHSDHFPQDAPDTLWLSTVGQNGWIVLTKDQNVGRNPLELQAIAAHTVKVFTLVSGNSTRQEMITLFVAVLPKIAKLSQGNPAPFIAKIYRNRTVKIWKNQTALLKLLKPPPKTPNS